MNLLKLNKHEIIYISFAFDSLLKINLGFRIHVGIFLILLLLSIEFVSHSASMYRIKLFIKSNKSILPFFFYMLLQYFFNDSYPGAFMLFVYYFVGIIIFYYFFKKSLFISINAIVLFQWIIVISGLIQFFLFKVWGYQLSFYEEEHYLFDASFATRLRGFFVEPNWYSIVFTFNSLLLIMVLGRNFFKYKLLSILSMLCLFFNGSFTSVAIVIIVMLIQIPLSLNFFSIKKVLLGFLLIIMIGIMIFIRVSEKKKQTSFATTETAINFGSRLFPILKTNDFMMNGSSYRKIFGYGLGSWPYIGLENNQLGYLGILGAYKIEPGKRDSAELQVFILEFGYLSLFFLFFDYIYNFRKYRKQNIFYAIACLYLASCFFIYPIYKFMMYIVPFYLMRSKITGGKDYV